MEYQFVYLPYTNSRFLGSHRTRDRRGYEESSEDQVVMEAQDWSKMLNEAAEEGYVVKESGVLQMAENVVLWALLEKS